METKNKNLIKELLKQCIELLEEDDTIDTENKDNITNSCGKESTDA